MNQLALTRKEGTGASVTDLRSSSELFDLLMDIRLNTHSH